MIIKEIILQMYISLIPVIASGVMNMVWCRSRIMSCLKIPMDNNIILKDGKRLFGDNKTWKGFLGMIIWGIVSTVIWGGVCYKIQFLESHNYMYVNYDNTIRYNIIMGFLLGLAYAVFELPNSFVKRRLNIKPGKHADGFKGLIGIFVDMSDSLFACVLVLCIVYKMKLSLYIFYVMLGAITHLIINIILFKFKLRKNKY